MQRNNTTHWCHSCVIAICSLLQSHNNHREWESDIKNNGEKNDLHHETLNMQRVSERFALLRSFTALHFSLAERCWIQNTEWYDDWTECVSKSYILKPLLDVIEKDWLALQTHTTHTHMNHIIFMSVWYMRWCIFRNTKKNKITIRILAD